MSAAIVLHIEGVELRAESREDEPRVRDIELANRAGMSRPRDIRPIVRKAVAEGAILPSEIIAVAARVDIGKGGKRAVDEYWLSESAALLVLTRLRTEPAIGATRNMIRVFREAQRELHQPVPAPPPAPAPTVTAVIESGVRMGDTLEGRAEVRRRCEVTARAADIDLRKVLGFVRRQTRASSPYFVGVLHWRTHVLPLLDDLAMGRLALLPPAKKRVTPNDPRQQLLSLFNHPNFQGKR